MCNFLIETIQKYFTFGSLKLGILRMRFLRIDQCAAGQQGQEELERKANSDLWRIQCESYHDLSWAVHKRRRFKEPPQNAFVVCTGYRKYFC